MARVIARRRANRAERKLRRGVETEEMIDPEELTVCIKCLGLTPLEDYLAQDYVCNNCADAAEAWPLATTPAVKATPSGGTGRTAC